MEAVGGVWKLRHWRDMPGRSVSVWGFGRHEVLGVGVCWVYAAMAWRKLEQSGYVGGVLGTGVCWVSGEGWGAGGWRGKEMGARGHIWPCGSPSFCWLVGHARPPEALNMLCETRAWRPDTPARKTKKKKSSPPVCAAPLRISSWNLIIVFAGVITMKLR